MSYCDINETSYPESIVDWPAPTAIVDWPAPTAADSKSYAFPVWIDSLLNVYLRFYAKPTINLVDSINHLHVVKRNI